MFYIILGIMISASCPSLHIDNFDSNMDCFISETQLELELVRGMGIEDENNFSLVNKFAQS